MSPSATSPAVAAPARSRQLDLCDPRTARAVARRAGLRLRRRYGQHLLVDRSVVTAILEALGCHPDDEVYEIGPGIGTLTVALCSAAARVTSVELDEACVRATRLTLAGLDNVRVIHGDALKETPGELGLAPGYLVAGNIPYSITGALITQLLEAADPPQRAVLLVQREVANRLAAPSGDWSLATVAVRSLARAEALLEVPSTSFVPQPAVRSAILRLTPELRMSADERAAVITLARATFQQRRKVLRHGVSHALGDESRALAALERAGIDARRRPGTLELDEWRRLAAAVVDGDA